MYLYRHTYARIVTSIISTIIQSIHTCGSWPETSLLPGLFLGVSPPSGSGRTPCARRRRSRDDFRCFHAARDDLSFRMPMSLGLGFRMLLGFRV